MRRDLERSSDAELIAAMGRGEAVAAEALYERHADRMMSLAYRMLGLRGTAEEVVKSAFVTAWTGRVAYRPAHESVRAWLLRITHDMAVDVLRGVVSGGPSRGEPATQSELEPAQAEFVAERAAVDEETSRLLAAFAGLAPEQSRVIELAYFGGYDQAEIAAMLEIPAGTVKSRMRAALERLHSESVS